MTQPKSAAATASRKITERGEDGGQSAQGDRQEALPACMADERHGGQRGDALPGVGASPGIEQERDDETGSRPSPRWPRK